jgi:predicted signal transduction protein with EAL and GGDEF domain
VTQKVAPSPSTLSTPTCPPWPPAGAALTAFADELGAAIIAEGVEREEELQALAALNVPYAQGYLLGRPGALASDAPTG